MPVMDGFQLCRALRANIDFKDIYFIAVSATFLEESDKEFILQLGADKYISKLDGFDDLVITLKEMKSGTLITGGVFKKPVSDEEFNDTHRDKLLRKLEVKINELEETNNKLKIEIEERKKAEIKISENEKSLNTLFQVSPIHLAIVDFNSNKVIKVNKSCLDFHKTTTTDFSNFKTMDVYVNPNDADIVRAKLKEFGRIDNLKLHLRRLGTGETCWGLVSYAPIEYNEYTDAVLVSVVDIDDMHKAEEEIKHSHELLKFHRDNSSLGYIEWDNDFRIKKWSKSAEKVFGWKAEELIGKTFSEWKFVHEDDLEKVSRLIENVSTGISTKNDYVNKNYTKDGEIIHCSWYNTVLLDENKNLVTMFSLVEDITEREIFEIRMKESEHELRELNATKDKFFSILAHDLRSPFLALQGYSDLLLAEAQESLTEEAKEYTTSINRTIKRLFGLLENLLQWARVQTGKMVQNPEITNLGDLITNSILLLKSNADSKSITVSNNCAENVSVYCDKLMIDTVIRNLLSNALKFTNENGKVIIDVNLRESEIEVAVIDNGIGMDESRIEKLFKIDEQVIEPGTSGERGTGLGLILCKELVEKNKGQIWVESKFGEGSKFAFTLPKKSD
ncbi:MAG: PAS domain S-box protein [Melioribacteraceae bacterium]|nr:PAS domain S-box protein [Melioribacteraceae bacterium]